MRFTVFFHTVIHLWIPEMLFLWSSKYTLWKFQEFSLTEKIFREINSLVTSLVKTLVSRNFCQKRVRENSRNFHIVHCTVGKNKKFSLSKKTRSNQFFTSLFSKTVTFTKFLRWMRRDNSRNFQTVYCNFTWNQINVVCWWIRAKKMLAWQWYNGFT